MLRWRIFLLVAASLGFMALVIVAATFALQSADHFAGRVRALQERLAAIAALDTIANRYGAQVADILLRDGKQTDSLAVQRLSMQRALAELMQVTRAEIGTVGANQIQNELTELANSGRLNDLFNAIDAAVKQSIALQGEGRTREAIDLYTRQVVFRLTNELQPLIDHEAADERGEMNTESANIAQVQFNLRLASSLLASLSLLCLAAFGAFLYRSVTRPLDQLRRAIVAVGDGKFDQRVAVAGRGEFSALSAAFNNVAATLAQQHGAMTADCKRLGDEAEARTQELSDARARLRSVESRQAQVLGEVSHELRTPLTVIRGEADVALRGNHNVEDQHQALMRIQGQAKAMGRLLEELINFARSDAQGHQHVAERISVEEVAAAAVQDCKFLAEVREINIESTSCNQPCWVSGDFGRLKQALVIGLDNAVKHSPPGATIFLRTESEGGQVRISITDEGPGIDAEDLPHVFERFFRSRKGGEAMSSGLGIGLSIARDIGDQHAGSVSLENRPNGGARFQIVLPALGGRTR